jgi:hypothetical protein
MSHFGSVCKRERLQGGSAGLGRILSIRAVAICFLAIAGCRQPDRIESYTVPTEAPPVVAAADTPPAAESNGSTDRMLAAILPDIGKAWFLKVVGPAAAVAEREQSINDFFATVRPAAEKSHPDWKLPEGWEERAGSGMRAATIMVPTSGKPLEISVTSLPWTGSPQEMLSNINRWRGQMQLAPTDEQGLADCSHELAAGAVKMTVVDLRGHMKSGGMSPPLAGGAPFAGGATATSSGPSDAGRGESGAAANLPAGHPPIDGARPGLPGGHPPLTADTAPASKFAAPLTYHAPDTWHELPAGGMRKASFGIGDQQQSALVTVIDFPAAAGPMMADPLANVNRWRGEVGLPPTTAEELANVTEPIEIDGQKATFVDAVPDASKQTESKADRGTLAAMLNTGDTVWFFKMTGDRDLIANERDRFKDFLKSVRIKAEGGAGDGNR